MSDLTPVIVPRSDQLNADDLIAGPRTIRITGVTVSPGAEQPVSVRFEGDEGRSWKPCKSMVRLMVSVWGADSAQYSGRRLTLYRDPEVKWGGLAVGSIRISHMSGITAPIERALTETRGRRKVVRVLPLADEPASAPPNDPAHDAARRIIAALGRCASAEALEEFLAGERVIASIARMREVRPELASQIDAAIAGRRRELGQPATEGGE